MSSGNQIWSEARRTTGGIVARVAESRTRLSPHLCYLATILFDPVAARFIAPTAGRPALRPLRTRRWQASCRSSRHAGFRHSETMKRRRPYPVPPAAGHPSRSGRGEANGDSRAAGNCCCSPLSACGYALPTFPHLGAANWSQAVAVKPPKGASEFSHAGARASPA
jgi:hypothetical protein